MKEEGVKNCEKDSIKREKLVQQQKNCSRQKNDRGQNGRETAADAEAATGKGSGGELKTRNTQKEKKESGSRRRGVTSQ